MPYRILLLATLTATLLIAACGGGGGGGDETLAGDNYTGETTRAVITQQNAADLAAGAFTGGQLAGDLGFTSLSATAQPAPAATPVTSGVEAVTSALVAEGPLRYVALPIEFSDSEPGECGGSADFTVDADPVTGNFSGTLDFDQFCEDGTVLHGPADFSGKLDLLDETIERFTLDFLGLSGQDEAYPQGLTLFGTTTWHFDDEQLPERATLDVTLRDEQTAETFWLRDYEFLFDLDPFTGAGTTALTGRYYDPLEGWVELSTPTPFAVEGDDLEPTAGVLLMTGAGGTMTRLTALGGGAYLLEGNFDGQPGFEYQENLGGL